MVQIGISQEAYEAIARTMPLGSVAVEPYFNTKGERLVWLEPTLVDRLAALRGRAKATTKSFCGFWRLSRASTPEGV